MPTCPFEKKRYWVEKTNKGETTSEQKHGVFYYQLLWKETKTDDNRQPLTGNILLLCDNRELRDGLKEQPDRNIIFVTPGKSFKEQGTHTYIIDIDRIDDYINLFKALRHHTLSPDKIVIIWSFDKENHQALKAIYLLINALFQCHIHAERIIFIYDHAPGKTAPFMEALSGYSNSLSPIWPKLIFTTIRVNGPITTERIIYELTSHNRGLTNEIEYRGSKRYIKKAQTVTLRKDRDIPIKQQGVYFITGGAGGLGLIFSKYLTNKYKASLILTGRTPLNDQIQEKLRVLKGDITYIQADASDNEQMQKAWESAKARYGRIDGVIHAAGFSTGLPITRKSIDDSEAVLRPKTEGVLTLDRVSRDESLYFFLLFSSTASILGDFGQCDYGPANRFLNSFAQMREDQRKRGERYGRTIAINWPLWKEGGIHLSEQTESLYLQSSGLTYLERDDGINAFEEILSSQNTEVIVFSGDRVRIEQSLQIRERAVRQRSGVKKTPVNIEQDQDDTRPLIRDLKTIASEVVKIPSEEIDSRENIGLFGFDSIALAEFGASIGKMYNVPLTAVVFFENSTIETLANYLEKEFPLQISDYYKKEQSIDSAEGLQHTGQAAEEPITAITTRSTTLTTKEIAIIGVHGIFPKSDNPDEYWTHLENMSDMIGEIPQDRWNWREYFGDPLKEKGKTHVRHGGFISGAYEFDPLFFNISPQEAIMMDPQQRKFMEVAWNTIEDAGYRPSSLSGKEVGVYVGVQNNEYHEAIKKSNSINNFSATGNVQSVIANRVSYLLNIHGPSMSIDTACSSSLTALFQAVRAINSGDCEMAIAGGVSLMLSPETTIVLDRLGVLSPDGRCRTFDKSANGYVRGEGIGAVLLKPLQKAIKDRDHIYGTIKSASAGHGGRAASLSAPNSMAQAELLAGTYKKANIDPSTISYIETHGTGTELGDPVEIEGIKRAFTVSTKRGTNNYSPLQDKSNKSVTKTCALGSVKSNIGHLEPAAGIAGVIKVLLAMENKKLPGNPQLKSVNPLIEIKDTPFYIVEKTKEWEQLKTDSGAAIPRRAAVSSFGFGGAYAHLVLEEYDPPKSIIKQESSEYIFVLSARTDEQLNEYAKKVSNYIDRRLFSNERDEPTEIIRQITEETSRILGISEKEIRADESLGDLGFEPLLLSELKYKLHERYSITTAPDFLTTIEALAKSIKQAKDRETNGNEDRNLLYKIVYTLQTGREELKERLAIVVTCLKELKKALHKFIHGNRNIDNLYRGSVREGIDSDLLTAGDEDKEFIRALIRNKRFQRLASLWVSGLSVDWERLYSQTSPGRISLPGYPFAKETYRIKQDRPWDASTSVRPLFYRSRLEKSKPPAQNAAIPEHLLIFGESDNSPDSIKNHGIVITFSEKYEKLSDRKYTISRTEEKHYNLLTDDLYISEQLPAHIVFFGSDRGIDKLENNLFSIYYLTRSLMAQRKREVRLLYIYKEDVDEIFPHHGAMSGLFKTIAMENPNYIYKTIAVSALTNVWEIISLEFNITDAIEVSYHDSERYVNRWLEAESEQKRDTIVFREKGVYLITGGAGALGLEAAKYIAEKTKNPFIILCGRREGERDKRSIIPEMKEHGAEVSYVKADISQKDDVKTLVRTIIDKYGRINGIIHIAGTIKDAYLVNKTKEQIQEVIGPKVFGAQYLDEETRDFQLDFFVMYSSASAIMGNPGQSDYAYANRFMDYYAQKRAREVNYGKTISISWSYWEQGGMMMPDEIRKYIRTKSGIAPIPTQTGMEAFHTVLSQFVSPHCMILFGDEDALGRTIESLNYSNTRSHTPDQGDRDFSGQDEIELLFINDLIKITSQILAVPIKEINGSENMGLYGFDSISYIEYARKLSETYGIEITPTVFYEQGTIHKLAAFIVKEFQPDILRYYNKGAEAKERKKTINPCAVPMKKPDKGLGEDTAIIGMHGLFPGAGDIDAFWRFLESETDLISEAPKERWNRPNDKNTAATKWGGFIPDVDKFDPSFFNISPEEACMMDPQHRIFMEIVWKVIEDAGYNASELWGAGIGVFAGASFNDYEKIIAKNLIQVNNFAGTALADSMIANRISFLFNFHGPSETIDTACSSSLVAIHRAVQSIHLNESEMAIAGGVSLILSSEITEGIERLGVLSPEGRCKTFDKSANGYVRGEGAGALLLKPLTRALEDNDNIHGIIKSTAVNHGGRANSLTAPNPEAQADVVREAYAQAGISPDHVTYIETHGTGTALGDSSEIEGIKKAFTCNEKGGSKATLNKTCGLGSVKTNIGHLEPAAGMAGIIKVLLAMKNKKLPGTVHLKKINPYIQLKDTPFYIVENTQPWQRITDKGGKPVPRLAGVSSFGFGGTNAHIVLQEHEQPIDDFDAKDRKRRIIPLSAKSRDCLEQYAANLSAWLIENKSSRLADTAYTLQRGRQAMKYRLAVITASADELAEKLAFFSRREKETEDMYYGDGEVGKDEYDRLPDELTVDTFIIDCLKNQELHKLAKLWVAGVEIDWRIFYPEDESTTGPRRIALPTYPFAKERYWIDGISMTQSKEEQKGLTPIDFINRLSDTQRLVSAEKLIRELSL